MTKISTDQTVVSVLTAQGRGAIAVVKVRGPNAIQYVDHCFHTDHRPFSKSKEDQIRFGRWSGPRGEELIAVQISETEVEVHCHGGISASSAIVSRLQELGAKPVGPQPLPKKHGSIEESAWRLLTQTTTERTAATLLDQAKGALSNSLKRIINLLRNQDAAATIELEKLLAWERFSKHLVNPWRVLLAGPPNVGKSSLINTLVGFERAIVFDRPGTTRDMVSAITAIDGWPVELFDTAGLRESDESIEAAGIAMTRKMIDTADLLVLVNECRDPESAFLDESNHPPRILVFNKADLNPAFESPKDSIKTSTITNEGIQTLLNQIANQLVAESPKPGESVPFLSSHYQAIRAALQQIQEEDLEAAIQALDALLADKDEP